MLSCTPTIGGINSACLEDFLSDGGGATRGRDRLNMAYFLALETCCFLQSFRRHHHQPDILDHFSSQKKIEMPGASIAHREKTCPSPSAYLTLGDVFQPLAHLGRGGDAAELYLVKCVWERRSNLKQPTEC